MHANGAGNSMQQQPPPPPPWPPLSKKANGIRLVSSVAVAGIPVMSPHTDSKQFFDENKVFEAPMQPPHQQQQNTGNAIKPPTIPQILTPSMHQQYGQSMRHSMGDQPPQMLQHQMSNHLSVGPNMQHAPMNNNGGLPTIQMTPSPMHGHGHGMYDPMHPSMNSVNMMTGKPEQQQSQLLQPPQLSGMPPQNQYMPSRSAAATVSCLKVFFCCCCKIARKIVCGFSICNSDQQRLVAQQTIRFRYQGHWSTMACHRVCLLSCKWIFLIVEWIVELQSNNWYKWTFSSDNDGMFAVFRQKKLVTAAVD